MFKVILLVINEQDTTIVNRLDALQLNQTMEKLMKEVRQVILEMLDDGYIDIYAIPDKLKRMKEGNITSPCGDKFLKPHKSSSSSISGVGDGKYAVGTLWLGLE